MNRETQLGPLAKESLHDMLKDQIKSLPKSYKVIWQREGIEKPFFPITVIEGTEEVFDEEMFGPVWTLYRAKTKRMLSGWPTWGSMGLEERCFRSLMEKKSLTRSDAVWDL
jgi:hypothetical protein